MSFSRPPRAGVRRGGRRRSAPGADRRTTGASPAGRTPPDRRVGHRSGRPGRHSPKPAGVFRDGSIACHSVGASCASARCRRSASSRALSRSSSRFPLKARNSFSGANGFVFDAVRSSDGRVLDSPDGVGGAPAANSRMRPVPRTAAAKREQNKNRRRTLIINAPRTSHGLRMLRHEWQPTAVH